jgi:hypothetical protein
MKPTVRPYVLVIQIVAGILLFTACKKEDGITPQTGNLSVTFRANGNASATRYINYFLYTETAYFSVSDKTSALWLRKGNSGQNKIEIKGLHPGNYVIVVRMESRRDLEASVQVVARRTNEFTL